MTLRPFLTALAFLLACPSFGQDLVLFPRDRTFRPSLADPLEPGNRLFFDGAVVRFDGDLGGTLDLLSLPSEGEGTLAWGLLAGTGVKFIRLYWGSFYLQAIDLHLGTYAAFASGPFSARLAYRREASHLGSYYFSRSGPPLRLPIPSHRDSLDLLAAFQVLEELRLLGGGGHALDAIPSVPPFFLHLGLEAVSGEVFPGSRLYLSYDLLAQEGPARHGLQAGLAWKAGPSTFRAGVLFQGGPSRYGQFAGETDDHWGLGMTFEP